MKSSRQRLLISSLFGFCIALLLAACGSATGGGDTGGSSTPTTSVVHATATPVRLTVTFGCKGGDKESFSATSS